MLQGAIDCRDTARCELAQAIREADLVFLLAPFLSTRKNPRRRNAPTRGPATELARLSAELRPTLRRFTRRLRPGLARLERQVEVAEARTRREAARLLRHASEELGRLEAKGERRWQHLTERARRDAVRWLHRVEQAIAKAGPRRGRTRARASRTKLDIAAGI